MRRRGDGGHFFVASRVMFRRRSCNESQSLNDAGYSYGANAMFPTIKDATARLEAFLAEKIGTPARVANLRQLTGGASRDTWSFDADLGDSHLGLVLRRDLGGVISEEALSREHE